MPAVKRALGVIQGVLTPRAVCARVNEPEKGVTEAVLDRSSDQAGNVEVIALLDTQEEGSNLLEQGRSVARRASD